MQMEEQSEILKYFNTTTRVYTITDKYNNQQTCETKHHIANQFLQAPEVSPPAIVCEEELWSAVKLGTDQYKIYTDNNGIKGNEMSTCNTPSLICSTADLGVDTNIPNTYNFLTTTYFTFPDGTVCESATAPFHVDVLPKPVAALIVENKEMNIGEGIALMDLVTTNKSGFWSGENITYLMTASGENIAYFATNTAGVYKLYYTVKNDYCERSYLLLITVGNSFAKPSNTQQAQKTTSLAFNVYPNPTASKVFIDLPDEAVYQISLLDISGNVMKQIETNSEEAILEINVEDIPKGMYMIELQNEFSYSIKKLIVE